MAWKTVKEKPQQLKPPPGITYSDYQVGVFDYVRDNLGTGKHLMVQACAGSGKSFTGVELFKLLPEGCDSQFVAFNKPIAKELNTKLKPLGGSASTYHSLGLRTLANNFDGVTVDNDKVYNFIQRESGNKRWIIGAAKKLTSQCKGVGLLEPTNEELRYLAFVYEIDLYDEQSDQTAIEIFNLTRKALIYSAEAPEIVDFDDMIWLPNILDNISFQKYDFLFVDEVQDTNSGQMSLAIKSVTDDGMIVGCGDVFQSIYAWRGADATAMAKMRDKLQANELPLSLCYRCPTSIRDLVNKEFPHIKFESPEWAIEGEIRKESLYNLNGVVKPNDLILCRVNADLITTAFSLIRDGIKATVRGRDIGKGIWTLIKKSKAYSVPELLKWAENWKIAEIEKALKIDAHNRTQLIHDKFDTLRALADGASSVSEVSERCNTLFSDDVEGVTLSSIHRAKGLEASNVFILRPDLLPHPAAKGEEQLQQENNIRYVAVTRAKETLTWVM